MHGKFITEKSIRLRKRKEGSHKGDNGRVLVVGGSEKYTGAIILASMASLRAGADLVTIAAPERAANAASYWPDFITARFKGKHFMEKHANRIVSMSREFDVMVIGNGMGLNNGTKNFAKKVISRSSCKKVIDADALKSIRMQDAENSVMTPHAREFEILLKNSGIREKSLDRKISAARKIMGSSVIILKQRTAKANATVLSKDRISYNRTGNPGMTVGGTGDVLAGVTAGIIAQGNELHESACAAAYICGKAGDLLKKKMGYGFTATDLADEIPGAMKKWL